MNLIETTKKFGTQEACVNYLEYLRWPEGVTCLQCDGAKVARFKTNETMRERLNPDTGETETKRVPGRFIYQCQNPECGHQFSVTTGTIFHDTHLELEKWFLAVALMVNAKKGLSSLQMKRDLKVARKTAWYLNHRIRKAMGLIEAAVEEKLAGTIEADETYIGGKYDARRKRARYDKDPVFGVVSRGGKARTYHLSGKPTLKGVVEKIKDNVAITADAIYTDESNLY